MLFISNGAQLIEKKIEIARKRMFLFSSDVVPPNKKSSYTDLIDKINKSRSFCATTDPDGNMQCVRAAGWKAGRLYYNYVPSALISQSMISGAVNRQIPKWDMFFRYYSIGKDDYVGNAGNGSASLLPTLANGAATLPGYYEMVLPAFDGSAFNRSLFQVNDVFLQTNYSSSGTINGPSSGIGRWSEDISSYLQNIYILATTSPDVVQISYTTTSMSALNAKTQYNLGNLGFTFPRLFAAYRTRRYGTYYFSGGGWTYSNTDYAGAYGSSQCTEPSDIYFGTGTAEDTVAATMSWGMMPIAFAVGAPIYAVVSKNGTDFVAGDPVLPAEIPQGVLNSSDALTLPKRFVM